MITLLLLLSTLFNTVSSTSTPCSGTSYSVPFPYGATGTTPDLVVAAAGVTIPYSSGWTINKVSSTSTGTITLATACTGTLTITRTTPRTQPLPLRTQGKLDLDALSTTLDRIEMQMQESVGQGGAASLTSLTLTTPLPVASGGTGAAPPNCGAGVLTSNGTTFSCVTLSGLAPPGTTGVLLQTVTPGSTQTGHMNISGTLILGADTTHSTLLSSDASSQFNVRTTRTAAATIQRWLDTTGSPIAWIDTDGVSQFSRLVLNPSTVSNFPTLQSNNNNPIVLTGSGVSNGTQLVIHTDGITHTSGKLLDIQNPVSTSKFSVGFDGVTTTTGVTSSGPVSGTTLTSGGLATLASATVTGTSTHTGSTALNGGVTIGSGGTAISKSVRGTATWNPGTLGACGAGPCVLVATGITVTGAVTGADCIAGVTSPASGSGYAVQCIVNAADSCQISIVNQSNVSVTFGSATFYCRVFNP